MTQRGNYDTSLYDMGLRGKICLQTIIFIADVLETVLLPLIKLMYASKYSQKKRL